MDISFDAREATVYPNSYKTVRVQAENVDISEILKTADIDEVIAAIGQEKILDHIGIQDASFHFNLIPKFEEQQPSTIV